MSKRVCGDAWETGKSGVHLVRLATHARVPAHINNVCMCRLMLTLALANLEAGLNGQPLPHRAK